MIPAPPARPTLPAPHATNPHCGSCWQELDGDGNRFYCEWCGLNYGDAVPDVPATYLDPTAIPCGKPCPSRWHRGDPDTWACQPCALPTGHQAGCWTLCEMADE